MTAAAGGRAAPPWLRDGAAAAWHEVRAYGATTWAMASTPAAFAASWWAGTRAAMNPLAMLATGAALVAGVRQLAMAVLDQPRPDGLLAGIASALGPYALYVATGVLCHLVLAPRPRRPGVGLTDTVAMALYAGAGPAALAEAIGWLVLSGLALLGVDVVPVALPVMLGVAFTVFCYVLASAFGGLHHPSVWRIVLAFGVAFPVTGLVFGYLDPPGNYGLHWVLSLDGGLRLGL